MHQTLLDQDGPSNRRTVTYLVHEGKYPDLVVEKSMPDELLLEIKRQPIGVELQSLL